MREHDDGGWRNVGAGGGRGGVNSSKDFIASFFDNVKDEGADFDASVFDSKAQDEAPKSGKTFDELGLNPK